MTRVLLVDDEEPVRTAYAELLVHHGYDVTTAGDGREALEAVGEQAPDVVVTDVIMPETDGFDLITRLHGVVPDVPVIAISGGGRMRAGGYLQMASMLGASAVLQKPLRIAELLRALESLGLPA